MDTPPLSWIVAFFHAAPLAALFVTVGLGYVVGKLTIGRFVLGGIAGTLLMGVLVGQLDIQLDPGIKSVFFALFIYAVGYQGGPQFFHSLNLRSLNQLLSAFLMCVAGLACVLVAAKIFGLDRGTAAGLAAGGLTQSAIIGTAGSAIGNLDVPAAAVKTMQTNVAVGYAVCYIFGSLGPIVLVSWFFPTIMRWDIRKEALALARQMAGGQAELEPGQFDAVERHSTRFYRVSGTGGAADRPLADVDAELEVTIEAVLRDGQTLPPGTDVRLQADDVVAVTGGSGAIEHVPGSLGSEVEAPAGFQLVEENREVILTKKHRVPVRELDGVGPAHGVFLTGAQRMGHDLNLLPDLELQRGDELRLIGRPADLDRAQAALGYRITAARVTDFVFFGLGMALGMLIGLVEFRLFGVPVTIGAGGGCLLSGLLFGWLRSVHPHFAALPTGASNFLRDFGLAVFVGSVGITAGPQALTTIQQYGAELFLLGVGVTLVPPLIVFFISYYVLRITNPIEALACMVGGRSANPGFAALLQKAGNATPVVSFTVTYAVANVFLTLWGPVIVGFVTKNAGVTS